MLELPVGPVELDLLAPLLSLVMAAAAAALTLPQQEALAVPVHSMAAVGAGAVQAQPVQVPGEPGPMESL